MDFLLNTATRRLLRTAKRRLLVIKEGFVPRTKKGRIARATELLCQYAFDWHVLMIEDDDLDWRLWHQIGLAAIEPLSNLALGTGVKDWPEQVTRRTRSTARYQTPRNRIRLRAISILERLEFSKLDLIPLMSTLIEDQNDEIQGVAADRLSKMGEPGEEIVRRRYGDRKAAEIIIKSRDCQPAISKPTPFMLAEVPHIVTDHPDSSMKIKAIHFLRRAREQADVIIPFLQRATGDQDYYVADAAIDALVELRPESQFAVPLLAEQIARRVPYLMGSCALKLKRYRGEVSGVIAPMIEALRDSAVRLQDRLFMVDALGDLGVEARPAIPILFEIIESNDDWPDQIAYEWRDKVRGAAASALA
ncbi:hypothetical protein HYR69_09985, partial [Candidatus Sumerlaeota bacterium]|nr:hypothetical protein [Candidatus Sumerlaeota bacterium]